ncbi:MAG: crotonase/enoyl-CoA hydratase family protein [Sulfurifustaceae bacterium]
MDKVPFDLPAYRHLQASYDHETRSIWCYLDPKPRPTFNHEALDEILDLQKRVTANLQSDDPDRQDTRYFVATSLEPSVFNLGGDLALFVGLIKTRDKKGLMAYGVKCIEALYQNATSLGVPQLTTISLVCGAALGGGFEAALSSDVLIAERSAQMGFPEILFNLFPGMGAYNLLIRRINPALAKRLIASGKQYSAEELHKMGIVDVLADDGEGFDVVREFMRQHARASNGHLAIKQVRDRVYPLLWNELKDIVEIWVDAALRVTARDLRMMSRLAEMQRRRPEGGGLLAVPDAPQPAQPAPAADQQTAYPLTLAARSV